MKRQPLPHLLFTLLLAAGLFWAAGTAQADFRLRVEDVGAGTGVVLTDTGGTGTIVFVGAIDSTFTINVTSGFSKPAIGGTGNFAEMDLNSVNVTSTGSGTLRITLEDTTFTGGPDGLLGLLANIGGTLPAGATLTAQAFANADNLVPGLGPDTNPAGALPAITAAGGSETVVFSPIFSTNSAAFSGTGGGGFTKSGPYSLYLQVTITFGGTGVQVASFDFNEQVVPAPPSMILALAGLPFVGLIGWRRRKALATC